MWCMIEVVDFSIIFINQIAKDLVYLCEILKE